MTTTVDQFRDRHQAVVARMADAATKAGRNPDEVRLIAVSKTFPLADVLLAAEAGMRVFGENRASELAEKAQGFLQQSPLDITWCAIGHLQRNKAREVAQYAHEFHALDSVRLANALQSRLCEYDRHLDVFVQVNTSHEEQKSGFSPEEVEVVLPKLAAFDRLHIRGLMTMAAFSPEESVVRPCFERLRELRDRLLPNAPTNVGLAELSMGMSGDFEWAIAEGATSVRVGTAIFGHRENSAYLNRDQSQA